MRLIYMVLWSVSLFISFDLKGQTSILGLYENRTGATEPNGTQIDILPNNEAKILSIGNLGNGEPQLTDQGKWKVNRDTLFLELKNKLIIYKIKNDSLISEFPVPAVDTIIDGKKEFIWTAVCFYVKTINYFDNGKIESRRSLKSISIHEPNVTPEGFWDFYYQDGNIKASGSYKKGKKKGEWNYYSSDGKLKTVKE